MSRAVAEQSATLAGRGQVGVTQMEETMRHVVEAAGSVNAKLATLNEKAGNISQVVTTITKVADQTNLLSLNAAIEAEKAGEYGRGFAVVATEIRRLADQTAVATYDIDQMVKAIQSAVSAGVMSMDKFSEEVRRGMQVDPGGRRAAVAGDSAGAGARPALRGGDRRDAGAGDGGRADHGGADAVERGGAADGRLAPAVESGDRRAEPGRARACDPASRVSPCRPPDVATRTEACGRESCEAATMKDWSIRRRILVSFGFILVLVVGMGIVALHPSRAHRSRGHGGADGLHRRDCPTAWRFKHAWSNDFLLTEGHALQPDPVIRQALETRLRAGRADLDRLLAAYETHGSSPEERQSLEAFKSARQAYTQIQDEILKTEADSEDAPEAVSRIDAQLDDRVRRRGAAIQAVVSLNRTDADASAQQIVADVTSSQASVIAGVVVSLVVVFVMRREPPAGDRRSWRRWSSQVQQSGIQVNTSVTEIAATAKEQQATANEIAATTTEIGATSREISATSKELVRTMSDVARVAEQSATLAGAGQVGVTQMEDTMRHVVEAAGAVNAKLATLNEKAGNISQVVTTITKVADQTNLLSLNAAIEAEKAGEYGRGFAVVATEIRRLADQTAVATYDIDQMVKAIQSAASAGVMSMDKFSEEVRRGMQVIQEVGGQLSQVIQQVQALAPRFEAVTEGMQAQATGAEQITEALTQLSEAARQTVESLRQSNLAIDELNQVALSLRSGVSEFTLPRRLRTAALPCCSCCSNWGRTDTPSTSARSPKFCRWCTSRRFRSRRRASPAYSTTAGRSCRSST